jgi:hypothetical protein
MAESRVRGLRVVGSNPKRPSIMNTSNAKSFPLKKLIGIGLIALALVGATSLCMKEVPLALFGERAPGVVKRVEKIRTSTNSKWEKKGFSSTKESVDRGTELTFMHIGFTTKEGKPMEVKTLATFNTEAKEGDSHPMVYLASNPDRAKIYSAKQLWLPMCVGFGFVTVALFLGVRCLSSQPFFPTPA